MGFFDGYDVASSGMSAQRTRINVVTANIANAQTTHTIDGGPYKKQNVIFQEVLLNQPEDGNVFEKQEAKRQIGLPLVGVKVRDIIDGKGEPVMRYEPSHPDANEDGYVAYPNINPVIEMVDMLEATKSYEANVSAFTTHRTIDTQTLDIIKT